jgi:hypothetical protein
MYVYLTIHLIFFFDSFHSHACMNDADAERAGPAVRPGPDGPLLRVPEPEPKEERRRVGDAAGGGGAGRRREGAAAAAGPRRRRREGCDNRRRRGPDRRRRRHHAATATAASGEGPAAAAAAAPASGDGDDDRASDGRGGGLIYTSAEIDRSTHTHVPELATCTTDLTMIAARSFIYFVLLVYVCVFDDLYVYRGGTTVQVDAYSYSIYIEVSTVRTNECLLWCPYMRMCTVRSCSTYTCLYLMPVAYMRLYRSTS